MRDREAYELVVRRSFAEASLVALGLEMQTRRLTVRAYGRLRGGADTLLANLTFFGVASFAVAAEDAEAFPQSARIDGLTLDYDDEADLGHATLAGSAGWSIDFAFDGLAYDETPAVLASLADDA